MKTYFITGGEGFIGYHICKQLLKNSNNKVVTYDAQKHYIPLDKSNWMFYQMYRIKSLQRDNLIRIRGDTTDRGLLKEKLEDYTPDVIIHLAALPIANISNIYPEEARRNILDGTVTLLDILREATFDFKQLIYTSSSMVYGDFERDNKGNIIPAKEEQPCNPVGLYGAMKLAGEYVTRAYNRRFDIPYTIIRPSAVYGPTDCNRRVTEIFLYNALQGKELRLDNGGLHKLDFSYVEDIAKGFILASNSKKSLNNTFNMTRGEGRTIKELAEIISGYIPNTKMVVKKVEVFRPNRGALNISKARELLGFIPEYSLEKGVKAYIDFVKSVEGKR
jgi:UDP-glucose 4-epimerase